MLGMHRESFDLQSRLPSRLLLQSPLLEHRQIQFFLHLSHRLALTTTTMLEEVEKSVKSRTAITLLVMRTDLEQIGQMMVDMVVHHPILPQHLVHVQPLAHLPLQVIRHLLERTIGDHHLRLLPPGRTGHQLRLLGCRIQVQLLHTSLTHITVRILVTTLVNLQAQLGTEVINLNRCQQVARGGTQV